MARVAADGYTVKEIVSAIQADVRALSGKLDGYMAAHAGQHSAEAGSLANMHGDPRATPAGRQLSDDLDAIGASLREEIANRRAAEAVAIEAHDRLARLVARHDILIQRLIGAGGILTILAGIFEALRTAHIILS